jgi:hypothetical protein
MLTDQSEEINNRMMTKIIRTRPYSFVTLVVTLRRYMAIYIARVSTSSYVEDWYIEIISYMRYMSIFHVRFM